MQSGREKPDTLATAIDIGTINVIVPTDVPIASDTRQLTAKSTTTANCGGISERIKYATLLADDRPTIPTKIPASRNMIIMVIMLGSPMPFPMISSF